MIEFEKKILLTEKEFKKLLELKTEGSECVVQNNYYYDSEDLKMHNSGITCRIREKGGVCLATVKTHKARECDCSIESSKYVGNVHDDSFFADMGIQLQGVLSTRRTTLHKQQGIEVVLDQNTYLGTTDYELEIEYNPSMINNVDDILSCLADFLKSENCIANRSEFISRAKTCKSKAERFFNYKIISKNSE
jgi:uncharacterized protein YjbK